MQPADSTVTGKAQVSELTPRALLLGVLLGVVFGASSLYLVLKVGLTVSASIPVAVIAVAVFGLVGKAGGREAGILESNIVQTAGSAGESIAFGLGVTMPAILILGFDLELTRVMLVGVLGGLLGILMMIPLRRTLIVTQHRELAYPEGTACAEVLKAAAHEQRDRGAAASVFGGFAVGFAYKLANIALKGWKDAPAYVFGAPYKGASVAAEVSPELLGVGYIIGPRIASVLCAGGVLAYLVLIPLIRFFGDALGAPLPPGTRPIRAMSPDDIRSAYVLYIGAGAVAAGGVFSLVRAAPTIVRSISGTLVLVRRGAGNGTMRTDQDIGMHWVAAGVLALIVAITFAPPLHMNVLGALLILAFGFLFATVSSRLTGEIGSSSNPISGMTVATLLLTCLIFLLVGWTGRHYYVTALSVGAVVCIAASNAGTTSQDLKTGFLVGATPRLQQYAILAGALLSALALGPVLLQLNQAATVYVPVAQVAPGLAAPPTELGGWETLAGPQAAQDAQRYRVWHKTDAVGAPAGKYLTDEGGKAVYLVDPGINGTHTRRPDGSEVRKYDAPKAVLVSYLIQGVLERELPWALVLFGVMIAVVLEMAGLPSLPFAVGVYLPLASSAPIFIGGMVRRLAERGQAPGAGSATQERQPGLLLASGYIAGGALAGILIAFSAGVLGDVDRALADWAAQHNPFYAGAYADALALLPFLVLVTLLYLTARRASASPH